MRKGTQQSNSINNNSNNNNSNTSTSYYKNRTSSQQGINKRINQDVGKKQLASKYIDNSQFQNISKNQQQYQSSLSPSSHSNQMLLSPANLAKNSYGHVQYANQSTNQDNSLQINRHNTQTSLTRNGGAIIQQQQQQQQYLIMHQNNNDNMIQGIEKLNNLGFQGNNGQPHSNPTQQMSSYLNQYHNQLSKQPNTHQPTNSNNLQLTNLPQQAIIHPNPNANSNNNGNPGNHSKKNSSSNIFPYRKSPQSQLNDIILQNKGQQNLSQKVIDIRYQKEQYQSQHSDNNQQHQITQGIQQKQSEGQPSENNSYSKGDAVTKFQNRFKHFNQIIQNVERDSNLQRDGANQQQNSIVANNNMKQISSCRSQQGNRVSSPQPPTHSQIYQHNNSHRQSVVTAPSPLPSEDLKASMIQDQQYLYQNQEIENQAKNHFSNISPELYNNNTNTNFMNNNNNNHYNNGNQIIFQNQAANKNNDPNEKLSIIASELDKIVQNFQSPGKKLNTATSQNGYCPSVTLSAMKNSSVLIPSSSMPQSASIQPSRHASGNLYAATIAGVQQQVYQQQLQQQKQQNQQQNKQQQIGYTNQNSLKYSKIINSGNQDEILYNNNYDQQFLDMKQEGLQNLNQSPNRYLHNNILKVQPSSQSTSVTATQKKYLQQHINQIQGKQGNHMQNEEIQNNIQEVKPFITDRAVYNISSQQYQQQQQNNQKMHIDVGNPNNHFPKQSRKGAFNNNLTKKKSHEMKEYRQFSSIDFKNTEQNSLIANLTYHNHINQNNPNHTSPMINPNFSQIQNALINNNQDNVSLPNNTGRQQRNAINSMLPSSTKPIISIQEKNQLMQANEMIQNLPHNNSHTPLVLNQLHQNDIPQQDLSTPLDLYKHKYLSPNIQDQINEGQQNIHSQNNNQINYNVGINTNKGGSNILGKQIQGINIAQALQKQESSPNSHIFHRISSNNKSITQRASCSSSQNQESNQLQMNSQLNNSNHNNYSNSQILNQVKSNNLNQQKSGSKLTLYLMQPQLPLSQSTSGNKGIINQDGGSSSQNTSSSNNITQNKSLVHNTNNNLQNNYLLSQKSRQIPISQTSTVPASGNNSAINGSNSISKLSQNLFGSNTTNSPNTNNVIKASNSALNLKISKQMQLQLQQQQQQQSNNSNGAAYKKQPHSFQFSKLQQPMSAKSGEQQIKERRKHSESTVVQSQSANNSNLMMIANIQQGKLFEEDFINESQLQYIKNPNENSSKTSLKSSLIYPKSNSNSNGLNQKISPNSQQSQQILSGGNESAQKHQERIQQIQSRLNIANKNKTPDRDRYPFNVASSKKFEQLKVTKSPIEKINKNQNTSPNAVPQDISKLKELQKNNSKVKLESQNFINQQNQVNQQQNNLIPGMLTQVKGNDLEQYYKQALLDNERNQNDNHHNQVNMANYNLEDLKLNLQNQNQKINGFIYNQHNNSMNSAYNIIQDNGQDNKNKIIEEQIKKINEIQNLQNQKQNDKINSQYNELNIQDNQVQQFQNILKKKNLSEQYEDKSHIDHGVKQHQHLQSKSHHEQQTNIPYYNKNNLSESNNNMLSEVSKTNNSQQSFVNPTNNSFTNPIKLQTIDSVIIQNPVYTQDKAYAIYQNQQNDEESIEDFSGYNNQQSNLVRSNNYHPYGRAQSLNQDLTIEDNNTDYILQNNDIEQYDDLNIQQQNNNLLLQNQVHSGLGNMQQLESALKEQISKETQQQKRKNDKSPSQNSKDAWREAKYKSQEQHLLLLEGKNQQQLYQNVHSDGREINQNTSHQEKIQNPQTNIQNQQNQIIKNHKNLKQQLQEYDSALPPLLSNIINERNEDKSTHKKNASQDFSDKNLKKNQSNKIISPYYPLSSSHKDHNRYSADEVNFSQNSSANKKNQKQQQQQPKGSPKSNQKTKGGNVNYQIYQQSPSKNIVNNNTNLKQQSPQNNNKFSPQNSKNNYYQKESFSSQNDQNQIIDNLKMDQLIEDSDSKFQFIYETQDQEHLSKLLAQNAISEDNLIYNHLNQHLNNKDEVNNFNEQKQIISENQPLQNDKNNNTQNLSQQDYLNSQNEESEQNFYNDNEIQQIIIDEQINDNVGLNQSDKNLIKYDNFVCQKQEINAELIQTLSNHRHKINSIVYSQSQNIIFTASHDYDLKSFAQIEMNSYDYECIQSIRHRRFVTSLEFFQSKNILISGGSDGLIKIFKLPEPDIQNNDSPPQLEYISFAKSHSGTVSQLKLLNQQDNDLITCGSDGFIHIWDINTLQIKQSWNAQSAIQCIEWIPESNLLLNLNQNNFSILDIRSSEKILQRENQDFTCIKRNPSNDAGYFIGAGKYCNIINQNHNQINSNSTSSILSFDLRKNMIDPCNIIKPFNGNSVNCIEIYENQNICIFGTDQSIEYFNVVNNSVHILDSQIPKVNCLSIDPIHNKMYSGSNNHDLRIYNLN